MSRPDQSSKDQLPLKRLRLDEETIQKLRIEGLKKYKRDDVTGFFPEPAPRRYD